MRSLLASLAAVTVALAQDAIGDPERGRKLFHQCSFCHNYENDQRKSGPSLRTLFGKVRLVNGQRTSDENVLALIQDGYNGMPSYRYQLRPAEFRDLLAFLKTLNARPAVAATDGESAAGKEFFNAYCSRCHNSGRGSAERRAGDLKGLSSHPAMANGKPPTDANLMELIDEGHGGMPSPKGWLDGSARKALLAHLRSL